MSIYDQSMSTGPYLPGRVSSTAFAADTDALVGHFGGSEDLLPLWVAEPYIDLAPEVTAALTSRADVGWYGYEARPSSALRAFWDWMTQRHHWDGSGLEASVSPSVGTSVGVLIEQLTAPGDGVILQPPVFTDFKTLISSAGRTVIRNPLVLSEDGYRMDLDDLAAKAAEPATRMLILCNPHNPVGRVWTPEELEEVAAICAQEWRVCDRRRNPQRPRPPAFHFYTLRNDERLGRLVGCDARTDQNLWAGWSL